MSKEQTDRFIKNEHGYILIGGEKVINLHSNTLVVPGLRRTTGEIDNVAEFGDSGDVFNHIHWRGLIAKLWTLESAQRSLVGVASKLMLRGKQARVDGHGDSITYSIIMEMSADERKDITPIFGGGITVPLVINFSTEISKVPADALTAERFKCIMRPFMIPVMMKKERFPAITESTGYGDMCRSLMKYGKMLKEMTVQAREAEREFKEWEAVKLACPASCRGFINASAIIAGCMSSKEVYLIDEQTTPGCIFWSGVHAMMNDASNKIRARTATRDMKPRLENSSFYSDFKRKMTSRGIIMVQTEEYLTFLKAVSVQASRFLRAGSQMTQEESGILDALIDSHLRRTGESVKETYKAIEEGGAVGGVLAANTAQVAEHEMKEMATRMSVKIPKQPPPK